jgi:hypothetical protein
MTKQAKKLHVKITEPAQNAEISTGSQLCLIKTHIASKQDAAELKLTSLNVLL